MIKLNKVMINTKYGPIEISLLTKKEGSYDNDNEKTTWVEYYLNNELVHRSVHVHLKKQLSFNIKGGL